jgi:hypothetical protein
MGEAYNPKKKQSFLFFTNDDNTDVQYNEAVESLRFTIADLNNEASALSKNYLPEQRKTLIE